MVGEGEWIVVCWVKCGVVLGGRMWVVGEREVRRLGWGRRGNGV